MAALRLVSGPASSLITDSAQAWVGSRTGAPTLGSGGCSTAFAVALFLNDLERDSITSRSPLVTLGHRVRSAQRLPLADVNVQTQKRQCGSAFALAYIFRLRSCKLSGAFVISPLPPMLPEESLTAGPLRSAGITPPHRYCRPVRLPLAFGPLSRCPRLCGLPCSVHF